MSKKRRVVVIVVLLVLVVVVSILTMLVGGNDPAGIEASGTVEATEADLGFQMPGRIAQIGVREGDRVDSGVVLASLDRTELLARRDAALAQATAVGANLREAQTGFRVEEIAQGRAALRAAEQRLANARRDRDRAANLFEGGAISQQALDHQETAYLLAEADFEGATERLRILEAGPRNERVVFQQATLSGAEASVRQLEATLEYAIVRAPFDGIVSIRHREVGEIIQGGLPVVSILDPADRWVRIYVREDQIGRLSVGQEATLTADSYPDRTYGGQVTFIASEAEFTPRNVQTAEERVKLVYRVKVRITTDPSFDLKPGLAADVRIETETE